MDQANDDQIDRIVFILDDTILTEKVPSVESVNRIFMKII